MEYATLSSVPHMSDSYEWCTCPMVDFIILSSEQKKNQSQKIYRPNKNNTMETGAEYQLDYPI